MSEKQVYFDDHPIFRNLGTDLVKNGLKFRNDRTTPIGDDGIFKKLGLYVDKLLMDARLPLRRKDLSGSFSWTPVDNRQSKQTLIKLNHYGVNDYFWGIREDWAGINHINEQIIKLCSYRFVVAPQTHVNFVGFPCINSSDLDRIDDIIKLIPSQPVF